MKIIITDMNGICWKFNLPKDTMLTEILECIERQFYRLNKKCQRQNEIQRNI